MRSMKETDHSSLPRPSPLRQNNVSTTKQDQDPSKTILLATKYPDILRTSNEEVLLEQAIERIRLAAISDSTRLSLIQDRLAQEIRLNFERA